MEDFLYINYLSSTLESGYHKWRKARNKGLQWDENETKRKILLTPSTTALYRQVESCELRE
jgi:hypothetical protein